MKISGEWATCLVDEESAMISEGGVIAFCQRRRAWRASRRGCRPGETRAERHPSLFEIRRAIAGRIATMAKRIRLMVWWALAAFVLLVFSLGAGALMIRQRSLEAELVQARAAFDSGHFALGEQPAFAARRALDGRRRGLCFAGRKRACAGKERAPGTQSRSAGGFGRGAGRVGQGAAGEPLFRPCLLAERDPSDQHRAYTPAEKILLDARERPAVKARYDLERAGPAVPIPGAI